MGRINVRMPAPEGQGAGQTATFKLPIGRRYHALHLIGTAATSGMTVAALSEIRVLANNKVIQRFSGVERNAMNLFDGRADAAIDGNNFILTIPFDRYALMTKAGEEETAINTGSKDTGTGKEISSLALEIDIAASGFVGAPSLSMFADQSESLPGGPGTVPHILRSTRDFAGAGEYDISDLPRGGETTLTLNSIFFKPSANAVSSVKIESDQYTIFERSAALNARIQTDGIRVPQAGYFAIDRTEWAYGGDPIPLVGPQDFRFKVSLTGAATLTIHSHYMGRIGD
jgi:hypothetical protein